MTEQFSVKKTDKPIDWTVTVPGSKSMTNRALLMAALTDGTVQLHGVLFSDDSRYFISSLQSLGFDTQVNEKERSVTVTGCAGRIPKKEAQIYVGSAGTAARFLTAMLGMSDGSYVIEASEQMKKRPMADLFALLIQAGARIEYLEQEGFLPIRIIGQAYTGGNPDAEKIPGEAARENVTKPLQVKLDISKSTQFLSAMLLIAPMAKQGLRIEITSEKTDGSYIRITRKMMEDWGVTTRIRRQNLHGFSRCRLPQSRLRGGTRICPQPVTSMPQPRSQEVLRLYEISVRTIHRETESSCLC